VSKGLNLVFLGGKIVLVAGSIRFEEQCLKACLAADLCSVGSANL